MTPEKKLIYEVFGLLKTHNVNPLRISFKKSFVMSISDSLTIDLKREVLENSMHVAPSTSANSILDTVNEATAGVDAIADQEMDPSDVVNNPVQTELDPIPEDTALPDSVEKSTKKVMHDLIFKDPWEEGRASFVKKDVLNLCAEQARRLKVKTDVRRCIFNGMRELANRSKTVVVGLEMSVRSEWWEYIHSHCNNLGLK